MAESRFTEQREAVGQALREAEAQVEHVIHGVLAAHPELKDDLTELSEERET